MTGHPSSPGRERRTGTQTLERSEVQRPRLWRVLLLNDDYTPMDFVVDILRQHFRKSEQEAELIMLAVHHKGQGVAGVYTRDIAESKAAQVTAQARAAGYPLTVLTEPEEAGGE